VLLELRIVGLIKRAREASKNLIYPSRTLSDRGVLNEGWVAKHHLFYGLEGGPSRALERVRATIDAASLLILKVVLALAM